ncbi:MAG: tetratricopeptide repeat protein [Lapillicoccus sp.]
MTILSPPQIPAGGPPGPAPGDQARRPEDPQARAARLALRRTLVVWSLPLVLVLLLVALKLLTMVGFGQTARDAYAAGDVTAVQGAGARLGFLNYIERHKAPFALGDALVLAGDFAGARTYFERALEVAPQDGLEACQVRVNLVLSLEKLGDAAKASSGLAAAKPYYDRVEVVVGEAPKGCFDPSGGTTGQELTDAKTRAEQKSQPPPQQGDQGQQPQQPSQDKQQQLDDKTKDNQQQRAQGQGDQSRDGASRTPVAKPW